MPDSSKQPGSIGLISRTDQAATDPSTARQGKSTCANGRAEPGRTGACPRPQLHSGAMLAPMLNGERSIYLTSNVGLDQAGAKLSSRFSFAIPA